MQRLMVNKLPSGSFSHQICLEQQCIEGMPGGRNDQGQRERDS